MSSKKSVPPSAPAITEEDVHTGHLDAIRELRSHPGFHLYQARIEEMIGRRRDDLELDKTPEQTWKLRGYLAALRDMKTIPEVLIQEFEAKIREGAR